MSLLCSCCVSTVLGTHFNFNGDLDYVNPFTFICLKCLIASTLFGFIDAKESLYNIW